MTSIARYCRFVLGYNLAVIVWGAYVRASGSGAGCGSHWPSCNGEVVPLGRSAATWIEYSHRVSSGLVLVATAVLVVWAFRAVPRGHSLRRAAVLALIFTLSEAAVGAGLVLFKLVAHDESLARALAISAHLLNTLLLLASLALAVRAAGGFASGKGLPRPAAPARTVAGFERWRWLFAIALAGAMVLAASGAVAALGDTLFPAASLRQGLAQDMSPASHLLLRLRAIHPFLALALGAYLLYLCQQAAHVGATSRRWANRLRLLVLGQWAVGLLNLGLLAPTWLQLAHLLLADLVWIALVLLAVETLVAAPAAVPHLVAAPIASRP
jgi:cytochrome c oxidase assembly protein subunit 15